MIRKSMIAINNKNAHDALRGQQGLLDKLEETKAKTKQDYSTLTLFVAFKDIFEFIENRSKTS
jgi:hypothetical protein